MVRWLQSAPVLAEPGGMVAPADDWDRISARAGVVAGLDQWRSRLHRFAEGAPSREPHHAASVAEAEAARRLAAFVGRLATEADTGPRRRWAEWAAWAQLLLARYLPEADDRRWTPEEAAALDQVSRTLEDLRHLDEVSRGTDLATFRAELEVELAGRHVPQASDTGWDPTADDESRSGESPAAEVQAAGSLGNGIFVGAIDDAAGLDFDVVHVVGLADAQFPGVVADNGILPPQIAAELEASGWPTRARRLRELREGLDAVVASAARAVLSWPRQDPRTGRANVPSRWVEALVEANGGRREDRPSFTAGLVGGQSATVDERDLADLYTWTLEVADVADHPLVRAASESGAPSH